MADLQTELLKLNNIRFDDDEDPMPANAPAVVVDDQGVMFNATHAAFEYIKSHPNSTSAAVSKHLGREVSARIHVMYNRGQLDRVLRNGVYHYYAAAPTYEVTSREDRVRQMHEARRAKVEARRARKAKKAEKAQAQAQALQQPKAAPQPQPQTPMQVDDFLEKLTIVQARAIYNRLAELFGKA